MDEACSLRNEIRWDFIPFVIVKTLLMSIKNMVQFNNDYMGPWTTTSDSSHALIHLNNFYINNGR